MDEACSVVPLVLELRWENEVSSMLEERLMGHLPHVIVKINRVSIFDRISICRYHSDIDNDFIGFVHEPESDSTRGGVRFVMVLD